MATGKEAVKIVEAAMALGFPLATAVSRALGTTLTEWGAAHGFVVQQVSMCLAGASDRPYPGIRDALCTDLDIAREYLDRLISENAKGEAA